MSKRLVPFAIYLIIEIILGIYAIVLDGRNTADWESLSDLCIFVVVVCVMVILGGIAVIHGIVQVVMWLRQRKMDKALEAREEARRLARQKVLEQEEKSEKQEEQKEQKEQEEQEEQEEN